MILLQIETAERFFSISPDTVFGLLAGGEALIIVALWTAYYLQTRSYTAKLVELNVSCVETLKELSHNLVGLRDAGVNMTEDLKERIDRTREHIAMKIDNFAEQNSLKNGNQKK